MPLRNAFGAVAMPDGLSFPRHPASGANASTGVKMAKAYGPSNPPNNPGPGWEISMFRYRCFRLVALIIGALCCCSAVGQTPALQAPAQSAATEAKVAALWLQRTVDGLPAQQAQLIRRAQATLLGNAISLPAWKPYRGVEPSRSSYPGIWNWDSAFHAIAISHWDPDLARQQFAILFRRQLPDGELPDVIYANGSTVTGNTKPPVMAWAIAVVDRRSPDTEFLRKMYPKLVRLDDFWMKNRGGARDGLFYYAGADVGFDSGWDNSIRWDDGYRMAHSDDHRLWAIDLNCYMVMHDRAMASIADRLGLSADSRRWNRAADLLAQAINQRLWDNKIGFYVDRDRTTGREGPALSPAGLMPLFVGIAPPDRAARVAQMAADPHKFFPGMPTVAYDTPGYESHGYWRGAAWLNTSYFALKGLEQYGYTEVAEAMRSRLLGWVARDRSIREYYDSRNGKGYGARDFGWSAAFTLALILDWNNNNLTWLFTDQMVAPSTALASPRRSDGKRLHYVGRLPLPS
ncbi:MAG: amylo-alpha-1,6-glucosidase [Acidobacteriaceae bacterium]